ncbi:MAG: type II toxin-antitoxin system VapC family toxin [Candidatus Helarchaeota archaeon]
MAVFLDTGFILALKNRSDKNHEISLDWMKRFLKNEFGIIHTSNFVFDELVTLVLVRLRRPDLAIKIGRYVLESPRIHVSVITESDFQRSWELFQRHSPRFLSFTDCSILTQCERLKCSLLATFDSHFKGLIGTINSS